MSSDNNTELMTASQAKKMRGGINIEGVIQRKGDTRTVNLKAGGTSTVCDSYLVDQQGEEIKITLWGDDISKVNNGTKIKITNGYTNTFNNEVSLNKGKFGQMEIQS